MKRALVCGAGGFIGYWLTLRLKGKGYWVRGVDVKMPMYTKPATDDFLIADLRYSYNCQKALQGGFDEVYQLAADTGDEGFIHAEEHDIMRNNMLINLHMAHAAVGADVPLYFFPSSVCIYPDVPMGSLARAENMAWPAAPSSGYGLEKLYTEKLLLTLAECTDMAVRIARLQETYGPYSTYQGEHGKVPAALCRKAALASRHGVLRVWGSGIAIRGYTYITDLVRGIRVLMQSNEDRPTNIGADERYTMNELAEIVIKVSGKKLELCHVEGEVGALDRNVTKERVKSLGWKAHIPLYEGVQKTYQWIQKEMRMNGEVV